MFYRGGFFFLFFLKKNLVWERVGGLGAEI